MRKSLPRRPGYASAKGKGRPAELETIYREESGLDASGTDAEVRTEFDLRKWRAIHRYLRDNPFLVSETPPRADQWRKVLLHVRTTIGEPELVDWLTQQINIAENLAKGVRDLRPRKNGPAYDVFMEWVANRKRKAHAILRWTQGTSSPDFPSFSASRVPDHTFEK